MRSKLAALLGAFALAARRLRKARTFSATVTVTLALGFGVTGAMFGLVNAVLIRPLSFPEANRLVQLQHGASRVDLPMTGISPGLADYYRAQNRVFEEIGVYSEREWTLTGLLEPERARVALVTPELFSVLRPLTVAGRILAPGDYERGGDRRAVISHDLWMRRNGGDPDLSDLTIEINRIHYQVVGVVKRGFHFPHAETQAWIAWGWPQWVASRAALRSLAFGAIARLRPGSTVEDADQDLARLVGALPDAFSDVTTAMLQERGFRARVVPLRDAIVGDVRQALVLLQAAAVFVLLITWANATNIVLVRGARLRRDVAVARALGARREHLVSWLLAEPLLLAALGGVLGLGLAAFAIESHFGFVLDEIPRLREVGMDGAVVGLVVALAALSGALLSGVAVLGTGRGSEVGVLSASRGHVTAGHREQRVQRLLVVGQVALALTLLIGSALMVQSFWRLKQEKLGFDSDAGLTFRLPIPSGTYSNYHASARLHDEVLSRLRTVPGIEAVEAGHVSTFPLMAVPAFYQFRIVPVDHTPSDADEVPWAIFGFATPGYFEAMRIPLLAGRLFRFEDTGRQEHGVILSASLAARLFGDANPIGRHVQWAGRSDPGYQVVGVVGDVPGEGIRHGRSQAFYFPNIYPPKADTITGVVHDYIPFDEVYLVKSRLSEASLRSTILRIVRAVDPKLVVTHVVTLAQLVDNSMARTRLTLLLLLVGAIAAVFLGVVGIYGVLSYTVNLRTAELGLRMALGASGPGVAWMVVRQGAVDATVGIVVGIVAAVTLTRYLRAFLYNVSPTDPVVFGAMAVLLFAVALAASYAPARRAGQIDPVRALHEG